MDAEPASEHGHTDALLAGCSHSVHFLIGEAGSSASPWLLRHPDQRVVTLIVGLDIPANVRIPRGNKPLDPWLPVPAALHCVHSESLWNSTLDHRALMEDRLPAMAARR